MLKLEELVSLKLVAMIVINNMQTFMPYQNFYDTFKCLDYRRLGKQRVEARQIWNIVTDNTKKIGWANHPAVNMWRGYDNALALYHNLCITEWINRGYKNNMPLIPINTNNIIMPPWVGLNAFHSAHRQTLLHKKYEFYSQFGWKETPKYEYHWPTKME